MQGSSWIVTRAKASRALVRLVIGGLLAMACGGRASGESDESLGPGACVDIDGQQRREGTRIVCDCSNGTMGLSECAGGDWGACECGLLSRPGTGGGPSASGGSAGAGGAPATCGNGRVEWGELCDGRDLDGETCATVTMAALPSGTLACTAACTFDMSGCTSTPLMGVGGALGSGGSLGVGGTLPTTGGTSATGGAAAGGNVSAVDGAPGLWDAAVLR